jgi:DNA repair protein RadC
VPSAADLELTSKLAVAGRVLDIALLDHFILAQHTDPVSLYEKHPKLFGASSLSPP